MKIAYCSDLHLEFPVAYQSLILNTTLPEADILILAGDIVSWEYIEAANEFLETVNQKYNQVIWIPGNHEYWGSSIDKCSEHIKRYIKERNWNNIFFAECGVIKHQETTFVCATLWTDFNNLDPLTFYSASNVMNDYQEIGGENDGRLYPNDILEIHCKHKQYISNFIGSDNVIVVTHHSPYGYSPNGCYHSNLSDLILDLSPKLWIHGHTHEPRSELVADTMVLSNPHGYVGSSVSKDFSFRVLEV